MRILAFIGFLVAYVCWIWASAAVSKKTTDAIVVNKTFWISQFQILLGIVPLFLFVFVLTGYRNWLLMAAFFGATQIGVILMAILHGLLGSSTANWGARAAWVGGEFAAGHKWETLALLGFCVLVLLAYPLAMGISYFRLPVTELQVRIFQYTLSVFVLSGYPFLLFFLIGVLVSENLDESTRLRIFINQLSGLIPNALWLAFLFWSFGIAGTGKNVRVGGVELALSPLVLGVLIAFFMLSVLIPFLIGAQRAKQLRALLLEKRNGWMRKLLDVVETPDSTLLAQKLADLDQSLEQEIDEFVRGDKMIAAGMQMDQGITPPGFEPIAPAYKLARDLDPRFHHLNWLQELLLRVREIRNDLGKLTDEPALEKAATQWSKFLQPRRDELTKEVSRIQKTRTPLMLASSSVIVPILSIVLSEFSKWLWTYFSKSLPG